MFGKKGLVALVLGASAMALPAFGQSEEFKSDVAVQALGSFVKDTTDNGVTHSASNSGGVLGTYRYYFGRHNGVEFNYGYTQNSQRYALGGNGGHQKSYLLSMTCVQRPSCRARAPWIGIRTGGA